MSQNRNFLIVFEGIDRSGKTSLMAAFNKLTNYAHPCVDRLYVSHAYYAFKRLDDLSLLMSMVSDYGNVICDGSIVYINVNTVCDYAVWEKRMKDTEHDVIDSFDAKCITQTADAMANHANIDGTKMINIQIDTSVHTPEKCAEILLEQLVDETKGNILL